ncbi:ribose-phosphate pyrophosphokinase, partial [Lacticaseibacillus paracasei]
HLGLKRVVITDTIKLDPKHKFEGLDQISVGPMLGKAIKLINSNQSIHVLF